MSDQISQDLKMKNDENKKLSTKLDDLELQLKESANTTSKATFKALKIKKPMTESVSDFKTTIDDDIYGRLNSVTNTPYGMSKDESDPFVRQTTHKSNFMETD